MKPMFCENPSGSFASPTHLEKTVPETPPKKPAQTIEQLKKKLNNTKFFTPSEVQKSETQVITSKFIQRSGSLRRGSTQKTEEKSSHFNSTDLLKKNDEGFSSTDRMTPSRLRENSQRRSSSKPPEAANEITTSLRSQEVLANKFIKEFRACLPLETDSVDFATTLNVLKDLRFIQNDPASKKNEEELNLTQKLWKLINGEEEVKVQNLLCICLNIMNLYSPSGHTADAQTPVKSWSFLHNMFVYNSEEALKIHKMFYELYQNRRLAPRKPTSQDQKDISALREAEKTRHSSLRTKEKRDLSAKRQVLKTEPNEKNQKFEDSKPETENKKKPDLRSGSRKRPDIPLRSPAPKPEPKKIPLGIRKEIEFISETPKIERKLERLKTEPCEVQSVRVFKEAEGLKKKPDTENKGNIFHKKSSSFAAENAPVQGIHLKQSSEFVDLAQSSDYSRLEASPKQAKNPFEEGKESETDDIAEEGLGPSGESAGKIPVLKPSTHAAALQLISFINDHNLSEDSAEKLLQIFKMTPK